LRDPSQPRSSLSLGDALARARVRDVAVAGLRPSYLYPARLPTRSFGGLGEPLRFSDVLIRSAPLARQLLALPYVPVCRLAVSGARWEAFAGGATRQRVPAAFGQPGGAFEMASALRFYQQQAGEAPRASALCGFWQLDEPMPSGGGSDEYCPVAEADAGGGFTELLHLLAATAEEYAASLTQRGTPAAAKIVDDGVAAAVVHWTQEPFARSLSVSARVHGGYVNGLKFWAALWREDPDHGVRHLSSPIELEAPGAIVARLAELGPRSAQSGRLMTIVWEQFEALRQLLARKEAANCWSEFSHQVLP
jgi:hypothetical protein